MKIDDRKIYILQAIINDYIIYGEPVGSRTIAKKYDLGISSATIRNEMADLEEMGYLEQLHTSSGRKPSDKGYRLYVDRLMKLSSLTQEEESAIKNYLVDLAFSEIDKIVKGATQILSELTNLTSIVKAPSVKKSFVKYIQLISLDKNNILSTIITDSGLIKHNVIRVSNPIDNNSLFKINNILNIRLRDISVEKINLELLINLKKDLHGNEEIFLVLVNNSESISNILENDEGELSIKIGRENFMECAKDCSIITATYSYNGNSLGTIGVIGPTRIPYGKVIAVLNSIVSELNINISKKYNGFK